MFTSGAFSQDFVFDKEKGRAVPSYVGQLKLMKGKVFKKSGEATKDVETGERFKKSDVIVTAEKSFAKVLIVDDTVISIGPQSEVRFDEFDFKDKSDRRMSITLIKGQLSGDVKNKATNPGDIKFRTKYTTMGIRGTYILMNASTNKSLDIAEYALLSGKAEVADHKTAKFEMKKGDRVILIRDSRDDGTHQQAGHLTETEFNTLQAREVDEEKDFKPFLPYSDWDWIEKSANKVKTRNDEVVVEKREENKPGWEENLQKLNQKLKENQKKR